MGAGGLGLPSPLQRQGLGQLTQTSMGITQPFSQGLSQGFGPGFGQGFVSQGLGQGIGQGLGGGSSPLSSGLGNMGGGNPPVSMYQTHYPFSSLNALADYTGETSC